MLMKTTARSEGNAYKVWRPLTSEYVVILCDGGIIALNKVLRRHGWHTNDINYISNIQADAMQNDGTEFLKVVERS